MTDNVERVAKAIFGANSGEHHTWDGVDGLVREHATNMARAAIAAMQPTPAEAAKVYALWGSMKYRDVYTELVGVFSDKEAAESTGRALFKEKMDGAATVFQERVSGPYPLKGYCDDVSYKFWVESLSVNAAIAQEDSQ